MAKWYQVTIDLSRGFTHSCHHPDRHKIPLEELAKDPSALHNTLFKMEQRKLMLEGVRPEECDYCWKIEDAPGENISDRMIKSTDDWAYDLLDETLRLRWDVPVIPTYVEVIFSSDCNLNCMYCIADASTSIAREMDKFGLYPEVVGNYHRLPRYKEITGDNPYIRAFWLWFPEIVGKLKIFRITGGEPLLSNETFKVLEYLEEHPNPDLELVINSNLSYSPRLLEKFISHVKVLLAKKAIKSFSLYASLDGYGNQAAYIRRGLDFGRFQQNLDIVFQSLPKSHVVLMCTYNILSVNSFPEMLRWIDQLKKENKNVTLDVSYLRHPEYFCINLLDESIREKLAASLVLMKGLPGFTVYEIQKFERIVNWAISSPIVEDTHIYRASFYRFIKEYDRRFNSDFEKTFPEYETFLKICKKADMWLRTS